jgi:hypothetical protein
MIQKAPNGGSRLQHQHVQFQHKTEPTAILLTRSDIITYDRLGIKLLISKPQTYYTVQSLNSEVDYEILVLMEPNGSTPSLPEYILMQFN